MVSLNYRDSRPIYEQIKDGLRKLIVTGAMGPDEKLPSVRAMATQLSINPNTIQRAYNELEGEGYIYSVPGKGSFASGSAGADEARRKELMGKARELLAELKYLGVPEQELLTLVREEPAEPVRRIPVRPAGRDGKGGASETGDGNPGRPAGRDREGGTP